MFAEMKEHVTSVGFWTWSSTQRYCLLEQIKYQSSLAWESKQH